MLNKVIKAIEDLQISKSNIVFKNKAINDATEMFNAGWDKLENGTVVMIKGNQVIVKNDNTAVNYKMADFNVNMGKLTGNIIEVLSTSEIAEGKKEAYLAQSIITKYYTIKSI